MGNTKQWKKALGTIVLGVLFSLSVLGIALAIVPSPMPPQSLEGFVVASYPGWFVLKPDYQKACAVRYSGNFPLYLSEKALVTYRPDNPKFSAGVCRGTLLTFDEVLFNPITGKLGEP